MPSGVTSVYVDVDFSAGSVLNSNSGDISIRRVNSAGTVLGTLAVDGENDSRTLSGASSGSRVRIDVAPNALDASSALVTLTFYSGSNALGTEIANATVQTRPATTPTLTAPPAPANLSAPSCNATSIRLTWNPDPQSGVSKYWLQSKVGSSGAWGTASDNITTTSYSAKISTNNPSYTFRVAAYGNGTTHSAAWSSWSSELLVSTTGCCTTTPVNPPPVIGASSYNFTIVENAVSGAGVGTVSATDPGDTFTWSIAGGNTGNAFSIGSSTGTIAVSGTLNRTTTPSYTLTVEASDTASNTANTTVNISVLPSTGPCQSSLGTVTTQNIFNGTWVQDCPSANRNDRYAHFVTFTLAQRETVRIDLTSSQDPFLFLLSGAGSTGSVITSNDDFSGRNSRITRNLAAGTYTIEATTYSRGTGTFSLTVQIPRAPTPTGLTAASSTGSSITLSWNPVVNAEAYKLERSFNGTTGWTNADSGSGDIGGTSYTVNGLSCNTTYHFRVSARGDGSPYSVSFGSPSTGSVSRATQSCTQAFNFTPSPLALGGTSGDWIIPPAVSAVYVDVDFAAGSATTASPGNIQVQLLNAAGTIRRTLVIDGEGDSGRLLNAAPGNIVRIKVDEDFFHPSYPRVDLTFHSGSGTSGPEVAAATIKAQSQPSAPTSGRASVSASSGRVTLNWTQGSSRLGSAPDHYEVAILATLYTSNAAELIIPDGWSEGLEGNHTAHVRHCNAAGGCSDSLQIAFVQPPFDVVLWGNNKRLDQLEWGLMDTIDFGILGPVNRGNYSYRIQAPVGTGLQARTTTPGVCDWPTTTQPWTSSFSPWTNGVDTAKLVRCGLGDGATDLKVWVRYNIVGNQFTTPNYETEVEQSWHSNDNVRTHKNANPLATRGSLFMYRTAINRAVDTWNGVSGGVTFTLTTGSPDVLVEGYATSLTHASPHCGDSIACTTNISGQVYPHLGSQKLWFETPPTFGGTNAREDMWTNDTTQAGDAGKQYMPGVMMHEFGHTAGLGHSVWHQDVMGYPGDKTALSTNDKTAMRAIYQNHAAHTP